MINWLGKKCPREFCNGDLYEELDQFLEPVIECFACTRRWDAETGKLLTSVEAPTLKGLRKLTKALR